MFKKQKSTDWSLCPYTRLWCFGRKVGDVEKCKLCEVEIKFKEKNNMKMVNGVEIKKEISEGWTIEDFVNEIDCLVFDVFMGTSIHRTPQNEVELSELIEDFVPKHMFHTKSELDMAVSYLTTYYSNKYFY